MPSNFAGAVLRISVVIALVALVLIGITYVRPGKQASAVKPLLTAIVTETATIKTNPAATVDNVTSIMHTNAWKSAFTRTRQQAELLADRIHQRFEFDNATWQQYFLITWNMPEQAWDILKYKLAMKLFAPPGAPFTMLFAGSSVTAGYDNHHNQSYPAVFQRRMDPIFDSLGLRLDVRNLGQHRVNCKVNTYCIHSMAGVPAADFLGWENTFGCGRFRDSIEFAARLAAYYKAVLYVSASGSTMPSNCAPSKDVIPWISEDWQPAKPLNAARFSAAFVQSHRRTLQRWYSDSYSVGKFTRFLNKKYKGVGVHGFNQWARSRQHCKPITPPLNVNATGCEAADLFKDMCHDAGGPHFMTQEAAMRSMDGQVGKGWNPSTGMHLLRGEILAYNYLMILLDVLNMIEQDMESMVPEGALQKYQTTLGKLQQPVPAVAESCLPWESSLTSQPRCYSSFLPQFNPDTFGLQAIVMGTHEGWLVDTFRAGYFLERYGLKDEKHFYKGMSGGSTLHLRLDNVRGVVKLFGLGGKQMNLQGVKLFLQPLSQFTRSPSLTPTELTNVSYDELTDQLHVHSLPQGDHVLTVMTPEPGRSDATALTHVIVF